MDHAGPGVLLGVIRVDLLLGSIGPHDFLREGVLPSGLLALREQAFLKLRELVNVNTGIGVLKVLRRNHIKVGFVHSF